MRGGPGSVRASAESAVNDIVDAYSLPHKGDGMRLFVLHYALTYLMTKEEKCRSKRSL